MWVHHHASIALVAASVLAGGRAWATPRLDLRWNAESGCIDAAALAKLVEATLGEQVFHGDATPAATLDGAVVKSSEGYGAHVVLRARGGAVLAERDLDTPSDDCSRLDESLAVVVAMMVDAVPEPEAQARRPLRVAPAPPHPPIARSSELREKLPSEKVPLSGEVEAGGAVAIGLLPDVSAGAFVRGGLHLRRWSVELAGFGWSASDATLLGSGARISAWAGELSGCGALVEGARASLRACLALGVGFTDATPIALEGGAETRQPLVYDAVALDGALRVAGPLWLHLRAGVCNPFVAPSYYFYAADGSRQDLPGPWLIEPTFSLGLSARFGS